nr:hypothetical protein pJBCL41_00327 [Pseudomonas sp.]
MQIKPLTTYRFVKSGNLVTTKEATSYGGKGNWIVERVDTVRIPRHSDTQPTLIRTPVPRSFGQAVGAQRRRGGIVSPGWLASSISASVCALIHPSD